MVDKKYLCLQWDCLPEGGSFTVNFPVTENNTFTGKCTIVKIKPLFLAEFNKEKKELRTPPERWVIEGALTNELSPYTYYISTKDIRDILMFLEQSTDSEEFVKLEDNTQST